VNLDFRPLSATAIWGRAQPMKSNVNDRKDWQCSN